MHAISARVYVRLLDSKGHGCGKWGKSEVRSEAGAPRGEVALVPANGTVVAHWLLIMLR